MGLNMGNIENYIKIFRNKTCDKIHIGVRMFLFTVRTQQRLYGA
jgi:hypothetical protein